MPGHKGLVHEQIETPRDNHDSIDLQLLQLRVDARWTYITL